MANKNWWSGDPQANISSFESAGANRGDVGALIMTAIWTVDSLLYLKELVEADLNGPNRNGPHDPSTKDVAHLRWACGSSITALDLCAAAIGQLYGLKKGHKELDMRTIAKHLEKLPSEFKNWHSSVINDPRYDDVLGNRNPLTHSRILRNFFMDGRPIEAKYEVRDKVSGKMRPEQKPVPELIRYARELSTDSVQRFLDEVLPSL